MTLEKSKYVFPNLLTLLNLFCGFYSIRVAVTATSTHGIKIAAWLIGIAMFCDLFDGRVARMTGTQSDFGVQLDSLSDAVSFGLAPATLMYAWGLKPIGEIGAFFAFVYVACAIIRLARFNVKSLNQNESSSIDYFQGLPTPLAAGTVISIVMAHVAITDHNYVTSSWNVALLSVLLGGLMVSNVKYKTFKDTDFSPGLAIGIMSVGVIMFAVGYITEPSVPFVFVLLSYIFFGLGNRIYRSARRRLLGGDIDENFIVEAVEDEG